MPSPTIYTRTHTQTQTNILICIPLNQFLIDLIHQMVRSVMQGEYKAAASFPLVLDSHSGPVSVDASLKQTSYSHPIHRFSHTHTQYLDTVMALITSTPHLCFLPSCEH